MKRHILPAAILVILQLSTVAEAQKASQFDAVKVAACVRTAMKEPLEILSPLKPSNQIAQADRERIGRELKQMKEAQAKGVKRCLTEEQAYQLGWFEFLEVMAVDKCGLTRTDALKSHLDQDDENTDLLNGAASWEPVVDKFDNLPFFRGQSDARALYRTKSIQEMCDDLKTGFGRNGNKFPGLVR